MFKMMDSADFSELNDFLGEAFLSSEISPDPTVSAESVVAAVAGPPSSIQYTPISPAVSMQQVSAATTSALPLAPRIAALGHCVSPPCSVTGDSSSDEGDDAFSPLGRPSATTAPSTQKTSSFSFSVNAPDDLLKKKIRRRERNREHAKKCRSRKKNYLKTLEENVVDLRRDNDKLRRLILTKFSKEEVSAIMQDPGMASALKTTTYDQSALQDMSSP